MMLAVSARRSALSLRSIGIQRHLRQHATSGNGKETLVVLGAGWAGYNFLQKLDKSKYNVISVSNSASFVTTPLLPSVVSGQLNHRDIIEPLRSASDVSFYHAWAEAVDFDKQVVTCIPASKPVYRGKDPLVKEQQRDARAEAVPVDRDYKVGYDKLVIATGCYNQTFGTPGVKENAYFLRDIESAAAIRYQIYELMDAAGWPGFSGDDRKVLLTWIIVGGGPTGSELAAELHDLVRSKEFSKQYPTTAPQVRIILMDAAPTILSSFDEGLAEYAREKFARDGIEVLTSRKIERVEPTKIVTKEDGEIPTGLVVWSTGNKASPLNESIHTLSKDKKESFIVNEKLQVKRAEGGVIESVYAMGDCAQIEGHPLPATAQVANQQGLFLAKLLSGQITEPSKQQFTYHHRGSMTNIGGGEGIIESPLTNQTGRLAWLAWRGYYWLSSLSFRTKVNLAARWCQNAVLGRDISRL